MSSTTGTETRGEGMSEMKHTKGPWTFEKGGDCNIIRSVSGEALMGDAQYYPWAPEKDADWHLIAAAPDLLRVCILLRDGLNSGNVKSKPLMDFSDPNAESVKLESLSDIVSAAIAKALP